ncbi:LysE/ArgO family amino acid transporter [uncultured Leifsonia sp.]|uniref:LysE/ArgO family amino acid transporter n=1 Tax=uncultured Leifsonia sp. TaxID=340359 RepID=UPI0028D088BA|nr:LysE/ArgO family amino acid transporter [uncultured Leifsonia sp.]
MPSLSALAPFAAGLGSGASLIVAIGAQNAFVLRQGLRREHVLPIVAICVVSDAVLITAGVAGIGALVTAAPLALQIVRWAGFAFLIGYAIVAARRALRPTGLSAAGAGAASLAAAIGTCLAITWLNPHVYLDTVLLLGSLSAAHGDPGRWVFGVGAATASLLWFTVLGFGARVAAPVFARPLAWRILDAGIAVLMAVLAVLLVV